MIQRVAFVWLLVASSWLFVAEEGRAQTAKAPEWKYGLELPARKANEKELNDKVRQFGVEAFQDRNLTALFQITDTGSISVLPAAKLTLPKEIKGWNRVTAFDLPVRKVGEAKSSETTKKIGVELYRDENTGALIYLTETGSIALVRGGTQAASTGGPKNQYGYDLRVRKGAEGDFTDKTQKFGVDVFKDDAGGTLIYICESGAIAAVPAGKITGGGEAKQPLWTHGLGLQVRKAGEKDFTDMTRRWGIEVFKDEKAGNLIYIAENGDLAVVPAGTFTTPTETKPPKWLNGQEVRVRRAGEKEFSDKTRKWGIEVFRDENTGNAIYMTEGGALAVLPAGSAVLKTKE